MNKLSAQKKTQVIAALLEGCSIRSTVRLTGVAATTILRLLAEVGTACAQDSQTKLAISWLVGQRDPGCAAEFIRDLSKRLAGRIQLTSDGLKLYVNAIIDAFADEIDYAQLIKYFGNDPEAQKRYSPATCNGCEKIQVLGTPDPLFISTSHVERQNLTMRMSMRRFTRLTNAFSKKIENHVYMVALFYMNYNFVRIHQTLKTTPAVAAGVSQKPWTLADIVALAEREHSIAA